MQDIITKLLGDLQGMNIIKDWLIPASIAIVSALIGALIAFVAFMKKEIFQCRKENVSDGNALFLKVEDSLNTLLGIKAMYANNLINSNITHPIERMIAVRYLSFDWDKVNFDVSKLFFLAPLHRQKNFHKWRNVAQINVMIRNFNFLMKKWMERNNEQLSLFDKLISDQDRTSSKLISEDEIYEKISPIMLAKHIKNTETVLIMTDSLIIQMYDFLKSYHQIIKESLKRKWFIPNVIVFDYQDIFNLELLKRVPKADYSSVENLFGVTKDILEKESSACYF